MITAWVHGNFWYDLTVFFVWFHAMFVKESMYAKGMIFTVSRDNKIRNIIQGNQPITVLR